MKLADMNPLNDLATTTPCDADSARTPAPWQHIVEVEDIEELTNDFIATPFPAASAQMLAPQSNNLVEHAGETDIAHWRRSTTTR